MVVGRAEGGWSDCNSNTAEPSDCRETSKSAETAFEQSAHFRESHVVPLTTSLSSEEMFASRKLNETVSFRFSLAVRTAKLLLFFDKNYSRASNRLDMSLFSLVQHQTDRTAESTKETIPLATILVVCWHRPLPCLLQQLDPHPTESLPASRLLAVGCTLGHQELCRKSTSCQNRFQT